MNFIQSQFITDPLTHLTPEKGYIGMKENGIKVIDRGIDGLIYKPPGFFISMNGDWERWCESENFRDVKTETHCDVYVKPNLTFIRVETIEDANELVLFLIPEIENEFPELDSYFAKEFPEMAKMYRRSSRRLRFPISDLLNFSRWQTNSITHGTIPVQREVWKNALTTCDGIYYVNNWELHMNTIFNTWDCDTLMLFDPRNVIPLQKKDG